MASIDNETIIKSVPQKGFFGHPRGLFTLFFTEFWERFSYYGMRALLLYYLYTETVNGGLGFDKGTAVAIMSIYGSLVYMSTIIGGWLADRLFGTANTVFYGGIFIMFGHIALAFPGKDDSILYQYGAYHNRDRFIKTKRFKRGWRSLYKRRRAPRLRF